METKDLNNIGLAYLQMVEKRNTEAKKNHAKTLDKVDPEELEGDHEDRDDKDIDNDGDVDSSDEYLHKKRKAVKKAIKKDDDEQEKFKAYTGPDSNGQQGAAVGEAAKYPHMMYDPKTGKGYKAETPTDHKKYEKMGYTHDKPEEIDEAMTMVSRKPHPEGGHIVTLKDKNDKKVVRHLHNGKVKTISKESVEIDEAKNVTTKNNALVSFYQIYSTKPRLAGHMNMEVLGGQHQMSAADIKNISNRAVKAGVGKMVKIDNSMLTKHIADYKKENKPAPPKIAVALSQHHAKSLNESTDLQEGAARQAAFHKGLMDYCKEIGKDHMDHKDFMDHAKHVKAGNWDEARAHADDQDTEVREKIHSLAIDHLGQGAASELYGGDRKLSKNESIEMSESVIIEVIDMDDAAFDEFIEHMTDEELQALEEGIIGGTARLLGKAAALPFKATAGAAKMAYRGGAAVANRFSRTGRADAMDRKVNKIVQKRIAKNDKAKKIEAEKARLNTSRDRLKTVRNDKNILKVPTNPASRRPAAPSKVGTAPNFTQFESVNVNEATIPDGQTAMTKKPELTKKDKKTMGKIADLMKTANESVNVDDVLALIDQGYTLDQAEAMVAEACGGGGSGGAMQVASRKHPDDKKLLKASRKQSKAGDNDRNMANNQRSIPAKGADTAPVRPGTKQNQRDFDKAARMAKSKDKVSVAKAPWESVEVDEGYGSMVSPEDRARIKARVDANMDKLSAGQKKIAKQTPPRHKITDKDLAHLRTKGHANSPQKESVMDRVSNMVEDIRVDIQEKKEINEGPGDINNPMDGMTKGGWQGSGPAEPMRVKTMSKKREKELRDAGKLSNSANNASHYAGEAVQNVNELSPTTMQSYQTKADKASTKSFKKADDIEDKASDKGDDVWSSKSKASQKHSKLMGTGEKRAAGARLARKKLAKMTKESVQEAAKPTAIHHSTPVTAAQANDEQAAGRWTDKAGRNTMTEKEFVDMHTIHPDVLPEFDGNVAAKKTAEAIKKAPKAVAKTPNTPTSKGDQKIMPDPTPYGGPAVKTESYMDKYAKYIRGEI